MPTYQYACTECDHRFEAVQAFTDDSLTVCPVCGGQLRKVYGSVGVVFKGSGFYRTDSRAAASTGTASANGSGEKSAAGDKSGEKSAGGDKSGDKKVAASSGDAKGSSASKTPASPSGSSGSATKAAS